MDTGIRLNKVLASSGLCSRRAADELIAQGRVLVNGHTADTGMRIQTGDEITVDGKPISGSQEPLYLMLNKPIQVVSTARDPQGRKTVLDCLPQKYRDRRLYPVGRLDFFSEGLILLTNDGPLAQRLMHPSHSQSKLYEVTIRGSVPEKALTIMRHGMTLAEGDVLAPTEIESIPVERGNTLLRITLHQGLNRQIRRMCRDTGLLILRLKRVAEGPLQLGTLPSGQVRELTRQELTLLGINPPSSQTTAEPAVQKTLQPRRPSGVHHSNHGEHNDRPGQHRSRFQDGRQHHPSSQHTRGTNSRKKPADR